MMDAPMPSGSLGLWWLGQAGFVFKTAAGMIVYLDPYLSDAAERLHGFKRLSLPPIAAAEVRADLIVFTHEHADHLDPDALPIIVRNNPTCRFAGPAGCDEGLAAAGVLAANRLNLEAHKRYDVDGAAIHTAPADHGDLSATALCLLLEFDGIRVLCTGDTAFRPELLKPLYDVHPDLMLPCINGAFGNMSHVDAAMLVQRQAKAGNSLPFWNVCGAWRCGPRGIHARLPTILPRGERRRAQARRTSSM